VHASRAVTLIKMILHVYVAALIVGLVANVIAFALGRMREWTEPWPLALRMAIVFGCASLIVYVGASALGVVPPPLTLRAN
jgi:hypothetical protein